MQANYFNIGVLVFICASVFSHQPITNRKPYAAGRFYTNKPEELKAHLEQLFSKSGSPKQGNTPLAILVPHAGYVYSGEVAASAFNQVDPNRKFERIFIIGSSHTTSFRGASVYCDGHFETPLGTVKVDLELAKKLVRENEFLSNNPDAHQFEHSLEVQLPFLQHHMHTDFKIVPVIIGSSTIETSQKLAKIFQPYLNEKNLFIISSDFSHYPDYKDACAADLATAEAIKTNKASNLTTVLEANKKRNIPGLATSLCGWSSVLTLLYMTEQMEEISVDLIQYKNSGDSPYGDKQRVVGYWAATFTKSKSGDQRNEFSLKSDEKKFLLKLARETLSEYLRKGKVPEVNTSGLSATLKTPCGAFVTLNKNNHLRGCIGHFEPNLPLWKIVQQMAVAAATLDSRFNKLELSELGDIEIEISVLTPLKRIKSVEEFILGKDGIYIKKGSLSGTFLPQVATQTGWSKEDFLGHCARDKAGLGWDGWKAADLFTYQALVFGEGEE